jgi:hypothetical protein
VISETGDTSTLNCRCCTADHDHDEAANACPGAGFNHTGVPCPHEDPARTCHVTPAGEDCPGEHCHVTLEDCTVCRPVTLEYLGFVQMGPVG